MKTRALSKATVFLVATSLLVSGSTLAIADENNHSSEVTIADTDAAKNALKSNQDIVNSKIHDTTTIENSVAYSENSNIVTTLPTKDDKNIQTVFNGNLIELNLPNFSWGGTKEVLPKLTSSSQEIITNPTQKGLQLIWKINDGTGIETLAINSEIPDGTKWNIDENGGLNLSHTLNDGSSEILLSSNTPWAIDKTGKMLPTYYEIKGSTILQHVDTTDAKFPIVADPDWAWWGSLAICIAEVTTIFVPGTQIIKAAKASKAAAALAKSPKVKQAINTLGGLNAAMSKLLGKLRGKKYSAATERALKKLLDNGKGKLFEALGLGGCYNVYARW